MSEEINSTNNDETQSPVEQDVQTIETTVTESVEPPTTNEVVNTSSCLLYTSDAADE